MAARKQPAAALVRDDDGHLVAVVDLLIDRPDLGPAAATLVAAGDPIPAELADLPRRKRP
jgi:hypothetical protein